MRAMITRHLEIWKASLAEDKERLKQKITVHEAEFLPAALEILENPASPIGRFTLWAIIGFLLIALLWAIFGHVDIVASATGRIIPKTHAKLIQPAELGVVRRIAVQNGDTVKAGDLLIALDPTINAAESERIRRELLPITSSSPGRPRSSMRRPMARFCSIRRKALPPASTACSDV